MCPGSRGSTASDVILVCLFLPRRLNKRPRGEHVVVYRFPAYVRSSNANVGLAPPIVYSGPCYQIAQGKRDNNDMSETIPLSVFFLSFALYFLAK